MSYLAPRSADAILLKYLMKISYQKTLIGIYKISKIFLKKITESVQINLIVKFKK